MSTCLHLMNWPNLWSNNNKNNKTTIKNNKTKQQQETEQCCNCKKKCGACYSVEITGVWFCYREALQPRIKRLQPRNLNYVHSRIQVRMPSHLHVYMYICRHISSICRQRDGLNKWWADVELELIGDWIFCAYCHTYWDAVAGTT